MSERTNIVVVATPSQLVKVRVKAVAFPFEVAEFLEKNQTKMKEVFSNVIKAEDKLHAARDFLKRFEDMLVEYKINKNLLQLIKDYLYCFGPDRCGPNLLLIKHLKPTSSLISLYNSPSV